MTKRFSAFIAMFAFFVVCVCGLLTDATVDQVCLRAIVAMAVFYFIGVAVGAIANRIILESKYGEEKKHQATDESPPTPETTKADKQVKNAVRARAE